MSELRKRRNCRSFELYGMSGKPRVHVYCKQCQIVISPPVGVRSIVISVSVCLFVCLSAWVSVNTRPYFSKFSVHAILPMAVSWSSCHGNAIRYVIRFC